MFGSVKDSLYLCTQEQRFISNYVPAYHPFRYWFDQPDLGADGSGEVW
ncbi:MAG: hypothetical protein IJQ49_06290 [Prevotella sp.]|nr:hypothetical protein [Prevotella sp.]